MGSKCDVSVALPVFIVRYDTKLVRLLFSLPPYPLTILRVLQHSSDAALLPMVSSVPTHLFAQYSRDCIILIFPVYHLFFRWRHYRLPSTGPVSLCFHFSSHFALPFSSTSFSFYKICFAPGWHGTYAFLLLSVHEALPYRKDVGRDSSVGIATRYGAGRSGDRIPVGGEIFRTLPDRPWGPPSLLYNGYRVFPGG